MRHFLGRLGEHQAAPGIGAIEAAAREIVKQGLVIELGIVAAEGELEAVLALGRAVAGAGGAAHLIEDGRDVAQKRDFGRFGGDGEARSRAARTKTAR